MSKSIFLPPVQYDVSMLPGGPFYTGLPKTTTNPDCLGNSGAARVTLNAAITAAFLLLQGSVQYSDMDVYMMTLNGLSFAVEINDPRNPLVHTISLYHSQNGQLYAGNVLSSGVIQPIPTLRSRGSTLTFAQMLALYLPICASILLSDQGGNGASLSLDPAYIADSELKDYVATFTRDSSEKVMLYGISRRISEMIENDAITLQDFPGNNVQVLSERIAPKAAFASGNVIIPGNPQYFPTTGVARGNGTMLFREARKEFEQYTKSLNWTDEEEKLIPHIDDDFPVPEEALKMARRYLATRNAKRPMVQFMWRGPTSYGKSTGIECLAALLHTPLLRKTCHPTMETQDFLADYVPDSSPTNHNVDLPTFEEMQYCPASAYEKLTGEQLLTATSQMCLEAYGKAVAPSGNAPRFKFVESDYIKALVHGYICEVQEASRIRNAGVLVGLNEYDRPGSVIPLINGEYRRRHQNAIVIFTDNIGYASCRPIDPSVLRRMSIVIDSEELPKDKLLERVKFNTGCSDADMLERMYRIYAAVVEYCKSNDLMDEGSVSPTEFEMLIQCVMLDGEFAINDIVKECLVNKAVSDPEIQAQIMETVVSTNII